jgi:hypothetical protein
MRRVVVFSGTKVEDARRAIIARGDDARSVGTHGEIEDRFCVPASLADAGGRAGVPESNDAVDGGAARAETMCLLSVKRGRERERGERACEGECGVASTRDAKEV